MKNRFVLLVIFIFLFTAIAFADTSVKAEVDKLSLTTDEGLTYKLVITSSAKKIPQPKLPKFEGFIALSNAQTSQISISSGTQKTLVVYVFILAPVEIGKLKIEPSQIEIKGKSYSSDAFDIEVKPGKVKPLDNKPKTIPSLPKESQPETEKQQLTL
jgi:hypothetical protein